MSYGDNDQKLIGRIAGISFLYDSITDEFDFALVANEYPHMDGADVSSMGEKCRTAKMKCYFEGAAYESHKDLLSAFRSGKALVFDHPAYGQLNIFGKHASVVHDDGVNLAVVDIEVWESRTSSPTSTTSFESDIETTTEFKASEAIDQTVTEMKADLQAALEWGANIPEMPVDPTQSLVSQIGAVTSKALNYVSQLDSAVATLRATLSTVTVPVNSLIASIEWAETLPGVVLGEVAYACERCATLYETVKDSPERFVTSYQLGIEEIRASLGLADDGSDENETSVIVSSARSEAKALVGKNLTVISSIVAAVHLAGLYSADQDNRRRSRRMEQTPAFDIEGRLLRAEPPPVILSVREIERSLAMVRTMLQEAVDVARSITRLKDIALQLKDHAEIIKIEARDIIMLDVTNETHLFTLLFANNLPISAADRVLALNPAISDPANILGEVAIYGR